MITQALRGFDALNAWLSRAWESWAAALLFALGLAWQAMGPLPWVFSPAEAPIMRVDAFKRCAQDHFCMVETRRWTPSADPLAWTRQASPDERLWVVLPSTSDAARRQPWRWAKKHRRLDALVEISPSSGPADTARRRMGAQRPADYGLGPGERLIRADGRRVDGVELAALIPLATSALMVALVVFMVAPFAWAVLLSIGSGAREELLRGFRDRARPRASGCETLALGCAALALICAAGALACRSLEVHLARQLPALRLDGALDCASQPFCPLGSALSDAIFDHAGPKAQHASSWVALDPSLAQAGAEAAARFGDPGAFKPAEQRMPGMAFSWSLVSQVPTDRLWIAQPAKAAPDEPSKRWSALLLTAAGCFAAATLLGLALAGWLRGAYAFGRFRANAARAEGWRGRLFLDFDQAFGLIDPAQAQADAQRLDLSDASPAPPPRRKAPRL